MCNVYTPQKWWDESTCLVNPDDLINTRSIRGPPSLDSSQLVPLAEAAQRLLQHLAEHCENKPAASIHVVSRDKVSVEDKMARSALRALRSSIVNVDPTKLMQEAGQIWSSIMDVRMKSYHLIETCILVLG